MGGGSFDKNLLQMPFHGGKFKSHRAEYMYVVNTMGDKDQHNIVNLNNGTIEFMTEDVKEFADMWAEMKA